MADTVVERKTVSVSESLSAGETVVDGSNYGNEGNRVSKPTSIDPNNVFAQGGLYAPSATKNILNNYRSSTYNFAFGPITKEALLAESQTLVSQANELLERDIRAFAVINSAGKGTAGLGINTGGINTNTSIMVDTQAMVDSFNKNSPGRFDMFIDNVAISTLIGNGSPESGPAIASKVTFDVFEPYSLNGFIEALQVSAKAAGYVNYMNSLFALRVQFQGYLDTEDDPYDNIVPMSTRYFLLYVTEVEVEVNERGTRYRISATPFNQMGFGNSNILTSDIKIIGDTVGEVLKNFFEAINAMVSDSTREATDVRGRNTYEISAPKIATVGEPEDVLGARLFTLESGFSEDATKQSKIPFAPINDTLTDPNIFGAEDPTTSEDTYVGATVQGSTSSTQSSGTGQNAVERKRTSTFKTGARIHDCIAAIVRDSSYVRELISPESLKAAKESDGFLTYFNVRLETDIIGYDEVNQINFVNYRYVLSPFKIHYTRVPGEGQVRFDPSKLLGRIKREYNYIYTGKNEEVLKFNLKFNNLFYDAIPAMFANTPAKDSTQESAGKSGIVKLTDVKGTTVEEERTREPNALPNQPTIKDASQSERTNNDPTSGKAITDPYYALAKTLHQAVLNKTSLLQGSLEILGDPYFLTTGGMGNKNLELSDDLLTADGQAAYTQGDIYINVNFRNPVDIGTDGKMQFDDKLVSFSGVYRVQSLMNYFKEGVFTQNIEILRMAGQVYPGDPKNGTEEELGTEVAETAAPGQQVVLDDSTPVTTSFA
jgi:hypothetical protein